MARSGETFDEFLLQAERVSRESELPRQGARGPTVAIDKANWASFDIGPLSPKRTAVSRDVALSSEEGAYRLLAGYSRGEWPEVKCVRERARPICVGVSASHSW